MADLRGEPRVVVGPRHRRLLRRQHRLGRRPSPRADEGHHRMGVVERIGPRGRDRRPAVRHRLPPIPDVHPAQHQPPQERRGIHHVHHHARLPAADLVVEEPEHRAGVADLQVIERKVPPVVHLEEAVPRPGVVRPHPGDPLLGPVLHLHHMRHRMLRPAVPRLDLHAPPPGRLGPRIIPGLLQPEGMHAQHRVIAGHRRIPVGQGARDPVAQHPRMPGEEVDLVPREQAQRIARRLDRHVLEHPARRVPAPLDQMAERRDMALLPRRARRARRRRMSVPRHRELARLGAGQVQPALQHMGHGEIRRQCQRRVGARHRIAAIALQLGHCRLVLPDRSLVRPAQRQAVNVGPHRSSFPGPMARLHG